MANVLFHAFDDDADDLMKEDARQFLVQNTCGRTGETNGRLVTSVQNGWKERLVAKDCTSFVAT